MPDVQFVNLDMRAQPSYHKRVSLSGYAIKVYAVYTSSFKEIIFLDSDNMALRDPAFLFDSSTYRQVPPHGVLFFGKAWNEPCCTTPYCNKICCHSTSFGKTLSAGTMATYFGQTSIMIDMSTTMPTKCLDFILRGRTPATLKLRAVRLCLTGLHI